VSDFKGMPDCPAGLACANAKIVWKDGRRYVAGATEGETYVPFDSFVQTALQQIVEDLGHIIKRLDIIEHNGLPTPFKYRSPKNDYEGLVP
jgi:hypothetical protein